MPLKMSSEKWRPFCLSLNVRTHCGLVMPYGISELRLHQNDLLPVWGQVITLTNTDIFSVEPPEYISMKYYTKFKHFHSSKCIWKIVCKIATIFSRGLYDNSPGPGFSIKIPSYQYRKSHCGDKTILRPSYLHNGFSYTVTSIGNPIAEIRRSYDRLISTMGFPILIKYLYIESTPWNLSLDNGVLSDWRDWVQEVWSSCPYFLVSGILLFLRLPPE